MTIEPLDSIDADPAVVHGQARARDPHRGERHPLAAGVTEEQIRAEYPSLPRGSVAAALAYTARLVREDSHPL